MVQPSKRHPHHSEKWTVAQKRQNLWMINFAAKPHVRVFVPSFQGLPLVGYLTPEEFHPASHAKILNTPTSSDGDVDPSLTAWAAANDDVCPAVQFKISGRVDDAKYISRGLPRFTFGLLNIKSVQKWACIPNIQQIWLQSVWALTGCQPEEWLLHVYKSLDGRTLGSEFTPIRNLTDVLPPHQRILLAIVFLHRFWGGKNYLATGVSHLVQLKIVNRLGENNLRNYIGEAGID